MLEPSCHFKTLILLAKRTQTYIVCGSNIHTYIVYMHQLYNCIDFSSAVWTSGPLACIFSDACAFSRTARARIIQLRCSFIYVEPKQHVSLQLTRIMT